MGGWAEIARLREAAAELDRRAAEVSQMDDVISRSLAHVRWEAPFASRFRAADVHRAAQFRELAEGWRSLAGQLRLAAEQLERELVRLAGVERQVRDMLARAANHAVSIVVPSLPPSGSRAWDDLRRSLAGQLGG